MTRTRDESTFADVTADTEGRIGRNQGRDREARLPEFSDLALTRVAIAGGAEDSPAFRHGSTPGGEHLEILERFALACIRIDEQQLRYTRSQCHIGDAAGMPAETEDYQPCRRLHATRKRFAAPGSACSLPASAMRSSASICSLTTSPQVRFAKTE